MTHALRSLLWELRVAFRRLRPLRWPRDPEVTDRLEDAWSRRWGDSVFATRGQPDWVRFHTLPDAKRYAREAAETEEILQRHSALLDALIAEFGSPRLVVIAAEYSPRDAAWGWSTRHLVGARWWKTLPPHDEDLPSVELLVSSSYATVESLRPLLAAVAENIASGVVITDQDATWRYHPYDGGVDVRLPTVTARDDFAERFRRWRPVTGEL